MDEIKHIIVHCSASDWGTMREINKWHQERFKMTDDLLYVGYHFIVLNGMLLPGFFIAAMDGSIEAGRRLDEDRFIEANEAGAHALGYNRSSIGVCMIGQRRKDGSLSFTPKQFDSLKNLLIELCRHFKITADAVLGHGETEQGRAAGKTCPDFNVADLRTWLRGRI